MAPLFNPPAAPDNLVFGDGSDGVVSLGTVTLTDNVYGSGDCEITAGNTVTSANYELFSTERWILSGSCNGPRNAGGAAGAAGAASSTNYLGPGAAGGAGNIAAGAAGGASSPTIGATGGIGGNGVAAGGAAGVATIPATFLGVTTDGEVHQTVLWALGRIGLYPTATQSLAMLGGAGGGGGGGDNVALTGGGGGSGGGRVHICAPRIVGNGGTLRAQGGDGGTPVGGALPRGGGAGGGGGVIATVSYDAAVPGVLTNFAGGIGGAGANGGTAGANGNAGVYRHMQIKKVALQ